MKNKEPKKKWTGKKQIWYGAAGLFCLVAAVLVLILGNGMGAQAEPLHMGDKTLDFTLDSTDSYYEIKNSAQLSALGNATADQTKDKNFKLVKDLKISSITAASTGIFAGTFDGKGYVITIETLDITDSTSGEAAQGVLFGTVTGTVQNVIVDVKDENASYTRISDAGLNQNDSKEPIITPKKAYTPAISISELDTNMEEAYNAISGKNMPEEGSANYDAYVDEYGIYEDVYLDPKTKVEYKENAEGRVWYRKLTRTVGQETTYKNTAKDAGNDSFGIVCGKLSGTLSQISVNGQTISIHHQVAESGTTGLVEKSTSVETYYYKVEEGDVYKFTKDSDWNKNVSVEKPEKYTSKSISGNNSALSGFSLEISAPAEVATTGTEQAYSIEYTITITPPSQTTLSNVTLTASENGTWFGTGITSTGTSNTCIVNNVNSDTEVKFTYTGTGISENKSMSFSGMITDSTTGQIVKTNTASASTKIRDGSDQTKSGSSVELTDGIMTVQISGNTTPGSYEMTVSNHNKNVALKDIEIEYPAKWRVASTDLAVSIDSTNHKITINKLDEAPKLGVNTSTSKKLTITAPGTEDPAEDGTSKKSYPTADELLAKIQTSITAKTATTLEQQLQFTTSESQITSKALKNGDLTISVTAPRNVKKNKSVSYTLSVTSNQAGTVLVRVSTADGTAVAGTWTGSAINDGQGNIVFSSQETKTVTFTPDTAVGDAQNLIFTASSSNGSVCQTDIKVEGYNATLTSSGNASVDSIVANNLTIKVEADPAIRMENDGTTAEVCYKLTVTGKQAGTVQITAPEAGKWGNSESGATGSTDAASEIYSVTLANVGSDYSATVYYVRTYLLMGTTWPQRVESKDFSVKQNIRNTVGAEQTYVATTTDKLTTAVYSKSKAVETATAVTGYDKLNVTLERPAYIIEGNEEAYTLTLENKGDDPLCIGNITDEWVLEEGNQWSGNSYKTSINGTPTIIKGNILEPTQKVTLTKSSNGREEVSVSNITQITKVKVFTYDTLLSKKDPEKKVPDKTKETPIYAANTLNAGAFAGTISAGTIEQSTQKIAMTGDRVGNFADNGAKLYIGGIAGRAENGTLTNVYAKGELNVHETEEITARYLVGTGTAAATNTIVTGTSDKGNLGIANTASVKAGSSELPDENWGNWKRFNRYTADGDEEIIGDLKWLVKESKETDTLFTISHGTEERITVPALNASGTTEYRYAYKARKQLEDEEKQLYVSTSENLGLENSGYYQPVNLYATDGYYHYTRAYSAETDTIYPFDGVTAQKPNGEKPSFFTSWSVERDSNTLKDTIRLELINSSSKSVYYREDTAGAWTLANYSDQTHVEFPFEKDAVTVYVTPVSSSKIYEIVVGTSADGDPFNENDRALLPAPGVEVSDSFSSNGNKISAAYQPGETYLSDGILTLTGTRENCSYQYYFSNEALGEMEAWSSDHTLRASETTAFDGVTWTDSGDSFSFGNIEGTCYLYVKVSAEHFPTTICKYEACKVQKTAKETATVYYDYANGTGTALEEGAAIAADDILVLEKPENAVAVEYWLADYQLSDTELHGEGWSTYEDPVTIPHFTSTTECNLYTRVKWAEGKYRDIVSKTYAYMEKSGSASASPRTVTAKSSSDAASAATIASGASIYMSSSGENVKILYLVTSSVDDTFTITRVNGDVSGFSEDANHFKIGNRWYQTEKEVETYVDKIVIHNEDTDTKPRYIHTAVLEDGKEPGSTVTFAYQISPMGQAGAPSASMDTLHFPGGEDLDSTKVLKGARLSFQSQVSSAEIYYIIGDGNGEVADHEDEATGTKLYDNESGIEVVGDYGNQFVIRMKAVKWNEDRTKKELKDSATIRFIYTIADQEQTVAPTATPTTSDQETTIVTPGDKILLSTTTKGATIYYTVDGSEPKVTRNEDGTFTPADGTLLYNAGQGIITPDSGNGYFTVRAIAVHPELANSSEVKFTYSFPDAVQMPYANIPSGDVDIGAEIILKNKTEGAEIYYTISKDGNAPADPTISSSVFDAEQPIVINGTTIIKAIAVKDGVKSGILTLTYNSKDQLSAPTASIDSGAMVSRGTRLKLKASDGATIYYTMDGSDPSDRSNAAVISGNELILDGAAGSTVTVKACARKDGKSVSEVVTFTYQISQSAGGVTADVPNGTLVSIGSKVNLMTDVTDAEIYYTTDGTSPEDHGIKGTVVTVEGTSGSSFTIKAVARVNGESGSVCTFTYKIKEKPAAPTASPSGGTLTVATRVELNSSADKIYYTTDGVTPTESSNLYKEPILINKTTTLKAIAVSADGEVSEVASFQYTAALKAEKPTASHDTNTVLEPGTIVALHTDTANAEIYYSTDGTEPTRDNLDSLTLYTEDGITINRTVTIQAVAYREDMQLSAITELYYQVDTIPAVEQKAAEQALLEEQQLKDTDSSELARTEETAGTSYQSRVLRERDYSTVVSSAWESIPSDAVLVTEEQDYAQEALNNVRQLFGSDYTIISSYNMYLMRGGTVTQPQGEVEIGMPIPQKYENAAVIIVYIDKNNKITKKETRRQDGMAYAKTDHFSHYALIGVEEEAKSGWSIHYLLVLEIAALITTLVGLGWLVRKKWQKMKREN